MADQNQLQRVADELEIRNIISNVALLGDGGDLKEYAELFTEDAHWNLRPEPGKPVEFPPVTGRANIVAAAQKRREGGISGPGTHHYHLVDTTGVKVAGDKATATTYLVFLKNCHKTPEVALFRIYHDEFRRTPSGWKLAKRDIALP